MSILSALSSLSFPSTVKPVLRGHSKEDPKYVFQTDNLKMQVKYFQPALATTTATLMVTIFNMKDLKKP